MSMRLKSLHLLTLFVVLAFMLAGGSAVAAEGKTSAIGTLLSKPVDISGKNPGGKQGAGKQGAGKKGAGKKAPAPAHFNLLDSIKNGLKDYGEKAKGDVVNGINNAANDAVTNIFTEIITNFDISDGNVADDVAFIGKTVAIQTQDLLEKTGDIITSTVKKYLDWEKLQKDIGNSIENDIAKTIDAKIQKDPKLKKICEILGYNGKTVVKIGKEIWSSIKSMMHGGSFSDSLMKSQVFQNVLSDGINNAFGYAINKHLTPHVNKFATNVSKKFAEAMNKAFGGKEVFATDGLQKLIMEEYNKAIGGVKNDFRKQVNDSLGIKQPAKAKKPGAASGKQNTDKSKTRGEIKVR